MKTVIFILAATATFAFSACGSASTPNAPADTIVTLDTATIDTTGFTVDTVGVNVN